MYRIYIDLLTAFICGALALVSLDAIAYDEVVQPLYYFTFGMSVIILALIAFSNYAQIQENIHDDRDHSHT